MAANKKPGNPWNQFPKKKAPGKLSTRTPKPTVTPSRAVGAGGPPAAPPGRGGTGGGSRRGGALVKASGNGALTSNRVTPVKVKDVTSKPISDPWANSATKPSSKPTAKPSSTSAAKPPVKGTPQAEAWLKEQLKAQASPAKGTPLGSRPLSSLVSQRGVGANALVSTIAQTPEEIKRLQSGYYDLSKPNSDRRANLTRALGSDPGTAAWNPFKSKPNPSDPKPGTVGPPTPKNNLATSVKGRPVGQQAVKGGKAVAWDGYKWTLSKSVGQSAVAKAPSAPKLPAATSTASANTASSTRRTGSASMRSPVRSSSPSKPATPEVKQSKDMNENYRIWAAANSKLADKVKKGQAGYNAISKDAVAGMGPVRDSASYKPSVSSSDTASTPNKDALKTQSGTAKNFRTDVALLDKKKKKVNG